MVGNNTDYGDDLRETMSMSTIDGSRDKRTDEHSHLLV